jgi:Cu/Ag efflux pump CusA
MRNAGTDPTTLGFAVVSLGVALEETLKALAEKNGNQAGSWLDEVQDLALLRAKARLTDAKEQEQDAATTALAAVEAIFNRMRSGFSGSS